VARAADRACARNWARVLYSQIEVGERGLIHVRFAALCGPKSDVPQSQRGANKRHGRATSAASLPCRLSPSTIQVGGVLLAREQRRLAAILTADVVGYSHAAYEQIYYSSLMPRTNLCARLLETLD
jgi:hypothetical protein